jgi:hypothetical protein
MWSVRQAVDQFIRSLELTEKQRAEVTRQQTVVREVLCSLLPSKGVFLSGSYSRNTAIRPLHDIDMFVLMGEVDPSPREIRGAGGTVVTQDSVLKQVRQALAKKWPEKELPILQQHSVHIAFSGSEIEFDVVPAFKVRGQETFRIPERETNLWIDSNPQLHAERNRTADRKAGHQLNPLIKVVKHWNRQQHSSPLRSFHLEAMSYSAFASPPSLGGHLESLKSLFEHLSREVQHPCPDPAGLGPNVDKRMTPNQREASRQLLVRAAEELEHVLAEEKPSPERAHARLKKFFGNEYRDRA